MTSEELRKILSLVESVFPLPTDPEFKGYHNFGLGRAGELILYVWTWKDQEIVRWAFSFNEPEDITSESLIIMKEQLRTVGATIP